MFNPFVLVLLLPDSVKTVERWSRQRIIPSYTFGARCIRYDAAEVRQALRKFEKPALRRLPRGNYKPRPRAPETRYEAQQLELRVAPEDPSQLALSFLTPSTKADLPSD